MIAPYLRIYTDAPTMGALLCSGASCIVQKYYCQDFIFREKVFTFAIPKQWRVGQGVKTPPFHGGITGSIPVRATKSQSLS